MNLLLLGVIIGAVAVYLITGILLIIANLIEGDYCGWLSYIYCWYVYVFKFVWKVIFWLIAPLSFFGLTIRLLKWNCNPWILKEKDIAEIPYEGIKDILKYLDKHNLDNSMLAHYIIKICQKNKWDDEVL